MIKRALYALFLLALPGVALGQAVAPNSLGTATTLNPTDQFYVCQTVGGCDLSGTKPLKQVPLSTLSGGGGIYTSVIYPSGNAATDTANISAAVASTSSNVVLGLGIFQVCTQIEVFGHLQGAIGTTAWPGGGSPGVTPSRPMSHTRTLVLCNDNTAFPTAPVVGFFHLHDMAVIEGFAIQGNRQLSGGQNASCLNAQNSASSVIKNMFFVDCYYGVDARANGTTPGDSGSATIGLTVEDNTFWYNSQAGIIGDAFATGTPGSGCSDIRIINNWMEVPFNDGILFDCNQSQILGNRIEDGGNFLVIENDSCCLIVANNFMNRINGVTLQSNGFAFQFLGNKWSGTEPSGAGQHFIKVADGFTPGIVSRNNFGAFNYSTGFYALGAGSSVVGVIDDNTFTIPGNALVYADTATETAFDPLRPTHLAPWVNVTPSGSTFTPDWQFGFNQQFQLPVGASTIANPVYTSNGQSGLLKFVNGPAGTGTVSFGTLYSNAPTIGATAYIETNCPWLTTPTNIVQVQTCSVITPSANLVTSGNGMASIWVGNGATFTPNSVTDPLGNTSAAALSTEDSSVGAAHGAQYTFASPLAAGIYSCSIWFETGTSNDRNFSMYIESNINSGRYVLMTYDKGTNSITDAYVNNPGGTMPTIYASGVLQNLGGYARVYMTFDMGTDTIKKVDGLANHGTDHSTVFYTGNNTSTIQMWGPVCRAGTSP